VPELIKTIKPDGSGVGANNYLTLALWEDAADADNTNHWHAECYAGNCGPVTLSGWLAPAAAPTSRIRIYAASGMSWTDLGPSTSFGLKTTKAYINSPFSSWCLLINSFDLAAAWHKYIEIVGMQFQPGGPGGGGISGVPDNALIDRCSFHALPAGAISTTTSSGNVGANNAIIRRCAIIGINSAITVTSAIAPP
jgi:hypothetical protein